MTIEKIDSVASIINHVFELSDISFNEKADICMKVIVEQVPKQLAQAWSGEGPYCSASVLYISLMKAFETRLHASIFGKDS